MWTRTGITWTWFCGTIRLARCLENNLELLPASVLKMPHKGCQLPECTISISWALSWNTPHSSTPPHYNSSLVNNHKSNGIHKPLRWCLLSLTLGSWDIHSRELCTSKPIICSVYAIFPSFIAWITLCVIIYRNISHHQSNMLYQIHSQCWSTRGLALRSQFPRFDRQGEVSFQFK